MADTPKHVIPRDGSAGLGGPRPDVPARPSPDHTAETGNSSFPAACTEKNYNGTDDARRAFELAHGTPSPRQLAQRARGGAPTASTTPKDLPPAPLG